MGRGASTISPDHILYGDTGPRKLSKESAFADAIIKKLSEPAQSMIKEMLLRHEANDGTRAGSWQAFELTKQIRIGANQSKRPTPSQAASYMKGLKKKGLVYGIQGPDMPRVQWQLTARGRLVAERLS